MKASGGASFEILVRLRGGYFFGVDFYCIFGRFEEMIPNSKPQKVVRLEPHGPHSERRPWLEQLEYSDKSSRLT